MSPMRRSLGPYENHKTYPIVLQKLPTARFGEIIEMLGHDINNDLKREIEMWRQNNKNGF